MFAALSSTTPSLGEESWHQGWPPNARASSAESRGKIASEAAADLQCFFGWSLSGLLLECLSSH